MEFRLLVRGDRACFKRLEFVEDLVSYDVVTPLAARGMFDALYTAPDARWRIDELRVLNPIRSTWMALNDIGVIDPGGPLPVRVSGPADRRMACVLSDVAYLLTGHFEPVAGHGPVDAHEAQFRRRIAAGRAVRPPFLGLRGFPADIVLLDPDAATPDSALAASGTIDLGWLPYDRARDGEGLRLFRAVMAGGVIDLRRRDALILAG